ncbi:hypothetical protein SAMN05444673_4050 [Bacillus sp. OV166]|nr:hypothetical protein SAMN05444673_4050 [Bacillus sp. OV166]
MMALKKYLFFIMLFGLFFPICQKVSLIILYIIYSRNSVLIGPLNMGLDSMINLFISLIAAILTYFFTNVFLNWESKKK